MHYYNGQSYRNVVIIIDDDRIKLSLLQNFQFYYLEPEKCNIVQSLL